MPWRACSFCRRRFVGAAFAAYHRWWEGEEGQAWRQTACPKCAETCWNDLIKLCVETSNDDFELPSSCANCGGSLPENPIQSFHSFFRQKARRDMIAWLCADCMSMLAPRLMQGGTELNDRAGDGGNGGAGPREDSFAALAALGRLP